MKPADKGWATRRAKAALIEALEQAKERELCEAGRLVHVAYRTGDHRATLMACAHMAAFKRLGGMAEGVREGRL